MLNAARAKLDEPAGLPPAERAARGKAARQAVPIDQQAAFQPRPGRPDPIDMLVQQGEARIAELLPIRYGRMLASPLAYFRGAALPMAADLAGTPSTALITQLCGDAHLSNFGIFASPERRLVFDINDFDETLPGPWEWDVKRLGASLQIAGRCNGFTARQCRRIVTESVGHYRLTMRELAGLGNLEVWYAHVELDELTDRYRELLSKRERELAAADLAGGHLPGALDDEPRELAKLVTMAHGRPRISSAPPLIVPLRDLPGQHGANLMAELRGIVTGYRKTMELDRRYLISQFKVADIARKVAGVGSVGMRCWMVLLVGRDNSDLLFLQVKEAQSSVLSDFAGTSRFANHGQRVVAGQRLMQAASDIFLGWHRDSAAAPALDPPSDYYLRQLRDWKFSLATEQLRPAMMRAYGALCGRSLARAHARSGDRIAIGSYLGSSAAFESAIADFAVRYADQNERDYGMFAAAVRSGRLQADRGV